MTAKVIEICSRTLTSLEHHKSEIPYTLLFMLRTLLDKSRGNSANLPVQAHEAPMIAELLAGVWLSNAFKWPESLGMEPAFKEEALTLGHLMTASRLVLETLLQCSKLPYSKDGHSTYNVAELNAFIQS